MNYTTSFSDFCLHLNIPETDGARAYFERGAALYRDRGNDIFNKARLLRLNREHNIYRIPAHLQAALDAADAMALEPDLAVYNYALNLAIVEHGDTRLLPAPDFDSIVTDFSPLYAFVYCFDDLIVSMKARNLPEQVISDTLQGFQAEMNDYSDMVGRPGMRRYVDWFLLFVYGELIRVGRLNFQFTTVHPNIRVYRKGDDLRVLMDDVDMHRNGMPFGAAGSTDEAGKYHSVITLDGDHVTGYAANAWGEVDPEPVTLKGYTEVLKRGDPVISVHIPAHETFTAEICQASYERLAEVLRDCYPEYQYKGFVCYSWMMEKRLRQIMGRDTNITRFASKFTGFPILDRRASDVYAFLYHLPVPVPPENLPENNSMQRLVKDYLRSGKFYYEKGGLFLDV